jgi:hypothetical protein
MVCTLLSADVCDVFCRLVLNAYVVDAETRACAISSGLVGAGGIAADVQHLSSSTQEPAARLKQCLFC